MNANMYQVLAMRTNDGKCTERLIEFIEKNQQWDVGGIINASFGMPGEVGELCDYIKKAIFHGHDIDKVKVKKEIGDCAWYLALMCESFNVNLEEIMQLNIDKLKARYPDGFDTEKSLHRAEGDI